MKRLLLILLAVLVLAGCANEDVLPTETTVPTTEATEPPVPWVETAGLQWDQEGILKEMPLTIPDGLHYTAGMEFDGDLLLWSMDTHRSDAYTLELCLIELDDGSVIATRDVPVSQYVIPRCLGSDLYICDNLSGSIYQLDKNLNTVKEWSMNPTEGTVYMGNSGSAYLLDYESRFFRYDLETGAMEPVLEGDPDICWVNEIHGTLVVRYYAPDNGALDYAVVDLGSGECFYTNTDEQFDSAIRVGDSWLYEKYLDHYIYYLQQDGGELLRFVPEESAMTLLDDGYLLETTMDCGTQRLYRMDGTLVSACTISDEGYGYSGSEMIWNESLGGYFFLLRSYDETSRLLFWDISRSIGGEDLVMEPVPGDDAVQAELEARAEELEKKYGLIILVGDECNTQFNEFAASQVNDRDRVLAALDVLDEAMAVYPEGFIRQLCQGDAKSIQIHLVTDLVPDGFGRTGSYAAFVQPNYDCYVMGVDIDLTGYDTYYHEMSHIIDSFLEWDYYNRDDSLYIPYKWEELNPGWFSGYSYDYSIEHELKDMTSFIDGYSTISPTEDRARVLEYAMAPYGGWVFEDAPVLQAKLSYYCRCIRDAFDTTGWPETCLWEQYLN